MFLILVPVSLAELGRNCNMATDSKAVENSQEIIEKKHRGIPEATFLVSICTYVSLSCRMFYCKLFLVQFY